MTPIQLGSRANAAPTPFERTAGQLLRFGMVLLFLSFGAHKFTAYEAEGIAPFVSNSPFTSWLNILGTQGASIVVGTAELTFGLLLAVGFWRPESRLALAGAAGSIVTYLMTLSFMLTTPDVFAPSGPPVLSGAVGQFLIKDIVLLAASILLLARGLAQQQSTGQGLSRLIHTSTFRPDLRVDQGPGRVQSAGNDRRAGRLVPAHEVEHGRHK